MPQKIALFPGSFDPFTSGHQDIVNRGLLLFDKIVIALGKNSSKKRFFDIDFMQEKIKEAFPGESRVEIKTFEGLTAEFAKKEGAKFILRGLRNTTDFEYENSIANINKHLAEGLETVFLITSPELAAISSTVIREVYKNGGDINEFIPYQL
ncbi:MAG: pantetheine-phosphate adenylyltransferase [Cytophagales bacterium]